ncbi:MAG: DDE-type integrase/transposase/recombinase, partial [Brevinema sp.]
MTTSKSPYSSFKQPDDSQPNIVKQNFSAKKPMQIITSDLTYVRIKSKFYYICFMVDLYSREIVTYSVSNKHNS